MGNWMTVTIEGTISPEDAPAAVKFVETGEDWDRFHCLAYYGPSLCGLGRWMPPQGGQIFAVGNCSERNYGPESVAETLLELVAVAPSLALKVHCGGDYESKDCVATVTAAFGEVKVGPAEVATVGEGLEAVGKSQLIKFMTGELDAERARVAAMGRPTGCPTCGPDGCAGHTRALPVAEAKEATR